MRAERKEALRMISCISWDAIACTGDTLIEAIKRLWRGAFCDALFLRVVPPRCLVR